MLAEKRQIISSQIQSQRRNYRINILKDIGYISLSDLANVCDFDAIEKLKDKDTQELFGAFKHDPQYANQDPIYFAFNGDRTNRMASTYVHPDIALQIVAQCRPVLALWITRQIREAMMYRVLNLAERCEIG